MGNALALTGMQPHEFKLGDTVTIPVTVAVNGAPPSGGLSAYTLKLTLKGLHGADDVEKTLGSDSDWLEIIDDAGGLLHVKIAAAPSDIPAGGASYLVGFALESSPTRHVYGDEDQEPVRWDFYVPRQGAYSF